MHNGEHPVIERVLSLIDHLQFNHSADGLWKPDTDPGLHTHEIQEAADFIDFMEEMPGGFLIYRAYGNEDILYANKGLLRMFRCDTMDEFRELTGNSFRGMVFPEDLEAVQASIWQQINASQFDLDYVEYRIIRKDGLIRWVEDYGHFTHSESVGDIFYVFLADATEKREQLQNEKARLLHEKERSEQKFQKLVQEYDKERALIDQEYLRRLKVIEGLSVSYESIFYVDLDSGRIQPYRLSRRTEPFFDSINNGFDYSECMKSYIQTCVHEGDRARVAQETSPAYARKRLTGNRTYYINYRVLEDGMTEYLQVRFVNVGRGNPPSQLVMGCRRVDKELQLEMEQKQMLEEALNSANSSIVAKNSFLSNMSHDMRTPLNAIFGFTALAKNNLNNPEVIGNYLNRIESSSHQLLDMIDNVLKLSWMDANEDRPEEDPCSLRETLEQVYHFLLPQAEEKGISFTMDCSQVVHDDVFGDQEKLSQLVMYLVNNAVTYTLSGGCVYLTATEKERLPNDCAIFQIAVRDTGIGISEEFIQQIFEPFTRERNTTLSGIHGVGLGLTLTKNIVDMLGGSIDVESAVGEGSTFTVTLCLRLQDQELHTCGAENGSAEGLCQHILLVEDNQINLEIETEILTHIGFTVDSAENGEAAVEMLCAAKPGTYDLILMDIQMPVMDGWEATQVIRALPDPALAKIPIVALSANVFESDIQKSLEAGMEAHLAKPLDVPLLLSTIQEISRRIQ